MGPMSRSLSCATALLSFFSLPRLSGAAPVIAPGGIVNAASYVQGPIVAGSLAAIFGTGLAASAGTSPGTPLPTTLNNVSVTMNGTAGPLLFVSPSQINAQVPWSLAGTSQIQVVVTNENGPARRSPRTSVASRPPSSPPMESKLSITSPPRGLTPLIPARLRAGSPAPASTFGSMPRAWARSPIPPPPAPPLTLR